MTAFANISDLLLDVSECVKGVGDVVAEVVAKVDVGDVEGDWIDIGIDRVGLLFVFLCKISCSNFNKFSLFGVLLLLLPLLFLFDPRTVGNDHSISEQSICTRLFPTNNSPATENTAGALLDSTTEECLPFEVEVMYVHGIISLLVVPERIIHTLF